MATKALVSLLIAWREDLTGKLKGGEACFPTLFKGCSSSLSTLMETYGKISSHLQRPGNRKQWVTSGVIASKGHH